MQISTATIRLRRIEKQTRQGQLKTTTRERVDTFEVREHCEDEQYASRRGGDAKR